MFGFSFGSKSNSNNTIVNKRSADYEVPKYDVPRDKEDKRFVKCFTVDQVEEFKQFFAEYGFVVIRNVLTPAECTATIDDIWGYIEKRDFPPPPFNVIRADPTTWKNEYWPGMQNEGIVGSGSIFTKTTLNNRQNPNIYKVNAALYGREDLLVNHDRYGLFRPTKNVVMKEGEAPVDRKDWSTDKNVHLDMNPWMYVEDTNSEACERILAKLRYRYQGDFIIENNEVGVLADNALHIQGLVNLADNYEEDGGFHIVPGFHRHIVEWSQQNSKMRDIYGKQQRFIVLPSSDAVYDRALRVTARAGSLVLWDQRTAHGSSPNNSKNIRYAQFFKMFPATPINEARAEARRNVLEAKVEQSGIELTDLGKKLFGIQNW